MMVLPKGVSEEEWGKIVQYYRERAPDSLPYQRLPAEPQLDPAFFKTTPFAPRLKSSAIITLLKTDSIHERIFVGDLVSVITDPRDQQYGTVRVIGFEIGQTINLVQFDEKGRGQVTAAIASQFTRRVKERGT